MGQRSFFDVEGRLQSVRKMADPLERLATVIPWASFRPLLAQVHEKERKSNAARKPIDVVLMFKVLIFPTLYNLSDEQVQYQIKDRLPFARFLALGIEDSVPDATTVRNFRKRLKQLTLLEVLFDRFGDDLAAEGYQAKQRQIADASIIPVPIQRNSGDENRRIKAGSVPEDWSEAKRKTYRSSLSRRTSATKRGRALSSREAGQSTISGQSEVGMPTSTTPTKRRTRMPVFHHSIAHSPPSSTVTTGGSSTFAATSSVTERAWPRTRATSLTSISVLTFWDVTKSVGIFRCSWTCATC